LFAELQKLQFQIPGSRFLLYFKNFKGENMSDLHWKTAITKIEPNLISVRGYPLAEMIGKISYQQMIYLLFKGDLPSKNIGAMIDAILVSSIDHGTTPPSTLSAITVASTGASLNASLAAGILAISKYHGGAIEECMYILMRAMRLKNENNCKSEEAVRQIIKEFDTDKKRISGFGHRIHRNDPRTIRLFSLANDLKISGEFVSLIRSFEQELEKSRGKKIPINVDGAIAALLCEMEIDPIFANAFFMIARVPGLVAHIYEEKTCFKLMRKIHPTDVSYNGPEDRVL
jgi:citrate synthase